jgi:hypothetical protein
MESCSDLGDRAPGQGPYGPAPPSITEVLGGPNQTNDDHAPPPLCRHGECFIPGGERGGLSEGVASLSPTDVWAVGDYVTEGSEMAGLADTP